MTLLEAVNRIFRLNAIIRGDTDEITSFSDVQHNASMNLAIIACQDELTDLIADRLVDGEHGTSSITTSASTRTYALVSGFTRFYGTPHFTVTSANRQIFEYAGGLPQLQTDIINYDTQYGQPNWWYWEPDSTRTVGFFQVPDGAYALTYDYEGSVMVSVASDTLPFHNDEENFSFCQMAARRFKFMFEDVKGADDIQAILDNDQSYARAKVRLVNLMKGKNAASFYGSRYA